MKNWDDLPDYARVWIYQAERNLLEEEIRRILVEGEVFLKQWTSHGAHLDAALNVLYGRLIVVSVDEQAALASGCGIDKSVRFIQELSADMKIDFFQRTVVLFRRDTSWEEAPLNQFWAMRKAMIISDDTVVLDTTVRTMGEVRGQLEKCFSASWHADMWGR
jgi:hypothetical protein